LVVITIIGILAALITVAAIGALKAMREAEIKSDVQQLDTGITDLKNNKATAFPPNCQTDGSGTNNPIIESAVLNDLKYFMKQAFPRHQEPPELIARLVGLSPAGAPLPSNQGLQGGMTAAEALVFWLGGFSEDPKYPISGEGGPSYRIPSLNNATNRTLDPIESRKWIYPFAVTRLGPRNEEDGYFADEDDSGEPYLRYIEYVDPKGVPRRINFWHYTPRKSQQPFLYFDTSRHAATAEFDPPAATELSKLGPNGTGLHVHAFKKQDSPSDVPPIQFINPDKFQIIHCGDDDAWGDDAFERMTLHDGLPPEELLLFPTGPFIGEIADTIVNFTTERKIEDAQQ
jgi:hypothetical protein